MKTSSSDLLLRALYREQQTLDNIHRSPTVSNMANTMFIHNVMTANYFGEILPL